ncbi:MAG: DUF2147 domain-containing protein [Bosea sp. (in: a-proteobacteria)]|uniref:DUF2147 domain-containing protein n=1 Tax=Bosea sp. (in: a-proteobacteria) TaxID=1871050 RepID=UPI0027375885|nr:DUF2147 domain-containing protein [Bosea sp. (in: a-proteobacteria)]MDP3256679.1 DUF2147 domain-containing protein [Bosea sp. (in: a-proteobacteria)]MDP3318995.1 DUF2147 domain-containing protein [Bosea sp. (in: a-proteobacteria)]
MTIGSRLSRVCLIPRASLAGLGLLALGLASGTPAQAQDVAGTWLRDSGASRVRFAKCGEAMCGTLAWLKDTSGPAKVGQRIFYDMKPSGDGKWTGSAFNPEDGKTYSGTMTLAGDKLTTSGCVLGGLICRSVTWNRAN